MLASLCHCIICHFSFTNRQSITFFSANRIIEKSELMLPMLSLCLFIAICYLYCFVLYFPLLIKNSDRLLLIRNSDSKVVFFLYQWNVFQILLMHLSFLTCPGSIKYYIFNYHCRTQEESFRIKIR